MGRERWSAELFTRGGDEAGRVLVERLEPTECPMFERECTPGSPQGAPMVLPEGACAAVLTDGATPRGN